MIKPILTYGDRALESTCKEVVDFTSRGLTGLIADLHDTLDASTNGIGLAAPQLGILERVFVLHMAGMREVFINPKIIYQFGRVKVIEGCLSIPGHTDMMDRAVKVTVDYQSVDGARRSLTGEGIVAQALSHEIDHLDGRLFIHYFGEKYCANVARKIQQVEKGEENSDPAALPEASFVQAADADDLDSDIVGTDVAATDATPARAESTTSEPSGKRSKRSSGDK